MRKERTYKQIEESRNRRLWITSVVIPLVSTAATLYSNPEIKRSIDRKCKEAKFKWLVTKSNVKNWIDERKGSEES